MEGDDSILLHEPDLMLAVLRVAAARAGSVDACIDHLRALRDRAEVEHRVPEGLVRARVRAVIAKLDRASLIEGPPIETDRGPARRVSDHGPRPRGAGGPSLGGRRQRADAAGGAMLPERAAGHGRRAAGGRGVRVRCRLRGLRRRPRPRRQSASIRRARPSRLAERLVAGPRRRRPAKPPHLVQAPGTGSVATAGLFAGAYRTNRTSCSSGRAWLTKLAAIERVRAG